MSFIDFELRKFSKLEIFLSAISAIFISFTIAFGYIILTDPIPNNFYRWEEGDRVSKSEGVPFMIVCKEWANRKEGPTLPYDRHLIGFEMISHCKTVDVQTGK